MRHYKINFLIILFLLLTNCSVHKKISLKQNNQLATIEFVEINSGLFEVTSTSKENMAVSPSGKYNIALNHRLIQKTDSIKLTIGNHFGMDYQLKSNINIDVQVKIVWILPRKIIDKENKKVFKKISFEMINGTNLNQYQDYVLENENELIPGKWTLEIFCNDKLICKKYFELIK